jgi:serine protease inhibitor
MHMKKPFLLMVALLILGLSSCDKSAIEPTLHPTVITLTEKAPAAIQGNNAFGIDLFREVAQQEQGNLMLSPLSAHVAVTMLLNGAHGETYQQIHEMLGFPADMTIAEINDAYTSLVSQLLAADTDVKLHIANALFYRAGFPVKEAFIRAMKDAFDADVKDLDFTQPSAVQAINTWAAQKTNNRIPKVLDQLHPDAVAILMNAIYFKGDWTQPFDKKQSHPAAFTLADGSTKTVPTMQSEVGGILHHHDTYTALELPYGRRNFSMIVLVPTGTLQDFYPSLRPELWQDLTRQLDQQSSWTPTMVSLPRFSFATDQDLNTPLQQLGMEHAFDHRADLSGIADAQLEVSKVKQNSFIEVNEEGAEAAAVTTVEIILTSLGPHLFVHRPFVFAIRERTTNTLLFIGAVEDPTQH